MSFRGKRLGNSAGDFAVNDAIADYSIPYKTAGGKVLWLPPGSVGEVLKSSGSSPEWDTDATGSDGGSGALLYNKWDPDVYPVSASALDEEWDSGPSVSGSYTALNHGTNTIDVNSTRTSSLLVKPNGSLGQWQGYVRNDQTIPSGDFSIACRMGLMGVQADFTLVALFLADGTATSSNIWRVVLGYHSSFGNWGIYSSTSSGINGSESVVWGPKFVASHEIILRMMRTSTTYNVSMSHDGEAFYGNNATPGFTPTRWGVLWYCNQSGSPGTHWWNWIRYQAAASAKFGGLVGVYS